MPHDRQSGQAVSHRRVRFKPFSAYTYDRPGLRRAEARRHRPLAESFPYIVPTGRDRFLLGASYGAHLVSAIRSAPMDAFGPPLQTIPTARNAHAIRTDNTTVRLRPHLGTDQIFQFLFDEKSGRLTANTPR